MHSPSEVRPLSPGGHSCCCCCHYATQAGVTLGWRHLPAGTLWGKNTPQRGPQYHSQVTPCSRNSSLSLCQSLFPLVLWVAHVFSHLSQWQLRFQLPRPKALVLSRTPCFSHNSHPICRQILSALFRTRYIICGVQCKIKMGVPVQGFLRISKWWQQSLKPSLRSFWARDLVWRHSSHPWFHLQKHI